MTPQVSGSADSFVREHHLHYDVVPEEIVRGDRREIVGFDVRVFGSHPRAKLESPACPDCVTLLGELRAFVERIVQGAHVPEATQIVPEPHSLYEASDDRGRDEVALTIRVGPLPPGTRDDAPALVDVRERLEAVGVPRRT